MGWLVYRDQAVVLVMFILYVRVFSRVWWDMDRDKMNEIDYDCGWFCVAVIFLSCVGWLEISHFV